MAHVKTQRVSLSEYSKYFEMLLRALFSFIFISQFARELRSWYKAVVDHCEFLLLVVPGRATNGINKSTQHKHIIGREEFFLIIRLVLANMETKRSSVHTMPRSRQRHTICASPGGKIGGKKHPGKAILAGKAFIDTCCVNFTLCLRTKSFGTLEFCNKILYCPF